MASGAKAQMKAGVVPAEQQKRAAWFALVVEHLPALYRFVRHEIAHYEAEGELAPGELSAEDVVDEMLLRAQRDFVAHPVERHVRGWLVRRAREQLEADVGRLKSMHERAIPLELDTSEIPDPAAVTTDGGDVMFYEPQELTPEDLFPEIDLPASPEQEMETKELQACVDEVLAGMPDEWRQALQLHYLDGFSAAELAEAFGRSEPETRRMLEEARRVVRRKLQEAGCSFKADAGRPEAGA